MFVHERARVRRPEQYAFDLIGPFGTLWFIYLLPIFFVTTKLACGLRSRRPWFPRGRRCSRGAPIDTGWTVIDEFCVPLRLFYTGYVFSGAFFALAAWVGKQSNCGGCQPRGMGHR